MLCPFCGGTLASTVVADVLDTQETGGRWTKKRHVCAACGAALVHDVVFKVGNVRESWRIERRPVEPVAEGGPRRCPECDGHLVSSWPPGVAPQPATGPIKARSRRETEHLCLGCARRFILEETIGASDERIVRLIARP